MMNLRGIKFIGVFMLLTSSFAHSALLRTDVLPTVCVDEQHELSGVWQFKIPELDKEYRSGLFYIDVDSDEYTVEIAFEHGILSGYDIKVQDNKLSFNMNLRGLERISFVLQIDDDKLLGEGYSKNFSSTVIAKRKLPGY